MILVVSVRGHHDTECHERRSEGRNGFLHHVSLFSRWWVKGPLARYVPQTYEQCFETWRIRKRPRACLIPAPRSPVPSLTQRA
jgi:hypothetical protein